MYRVWRRRRERERLVVIQNHPARPGHARTVQTLELPAAGPLHPKRLGNLEKPPSLFGHFRPDPVR